MATSTEKPVGFRWLHESVGTNWRMMSIQAVLGLRQLGQLDAWRIQRTRNAEIWMETLSGLPLVHIPQLGEEHTHAWYRFYCHVRPERLASGWTRDRLIAAIAAAGVPAFSGSCSEIYREAAFRDAGAPEAPLPVARLLGETSLAFLVDPSWDADETTAAAETARGVIIGASRDFIPTYQPAEVRERVLLRMVRSQAGILAAQSEAARRAGMGGETAGHL